MLANIFSSLSSASRPIDAPTPEPPLQLSHSPFLSPIYGTIQFSIQTYMTHSLMWRPNIDTCGWDALSKHTVTKVEFRRHLPIAAKLGHEDIVATILDDQGHTGLLEIGRYGCAHVRPEKPYTTGELIIDISTRKPFRSLSLGEQYLPDCQNINTPPGYTQVNLIHVWPPSYYNHPDNFVVLCEFEPSPDSLSLLQLGVIIEAANDYRPDSPLSQSQWCHCLSVMILGVSMLLGGRVKTFGKNWSKADPEPTWQSLNSHMSGELSDPGFPADIMAPPIPGLLEDDVQGRFHHVSSGVTEGSMLFTNATPFNLKDIWTIGQESQKLYDFLSKAPSAGQSFFRKDDVIRAMEAYKKAEAFKANREHQRQ